MYDWFPSVLKGERRNMKKSIVFLVLALVSTSAFLSVRPVFAADVTLPFQDGFESGNFSKWSYLAGGSVTSGGAHHGTYKAVFSSGYIQAQFTPVDQCFMRAYVMFKAFPASGSDCTVFGIWKKTSPSRYMAEVRVVNVGGTVKWRLRYWDSTMYYYVNSELMKPVLDTWYCVEVKGKSNTITNAESRIYINGNELTDITQTGKNNDYQINQVYIWISGSSTIWYDCVVVDTAYIGPETYTLTTSVVGGGSVSKNPDQATYPWGTNVELTAHASLGWTFAGWSGGASGTSNPVTVTITDNTAVTATFTRNPVGGVWVPIDKTELLAPWIILASLITVAAVSVVYVKRKKKKQQN